MSPTRFLLVALLLAFAIPLALFSLGFSTGSARLLGLPLFVGSLVLLNRISRAREARRGGNTDPAATSLRSLVALPGVRAYFLPWKRYARFSGRASLEEFWYFTLLNGVGLGLLGRFAGSHVAIAAVGATVALATILPGIAVAVRRVHDTDTSGKFLLLGLFPFVGWIVIFPKFMEAGTPGDNRFGPNPDGIAAEVPTVDELASTEATNA